LKAFRNPEPLDLDQPDSTLVSADGRFDTAANAAKTAPLRVQKYCDFNDPQALRLCSAAKPFLVAAFDLDGLPASRLPRERNQPKSNYATEDRPMKHFVFALGTVIFAAGAAQAEETLEQKAPTPINSSVHHAKFVKIRMRSTAPENVKTYASGHVNVDKSGGVIRSLTLSLRPGECLKSSPCPAGESVGEELTTLPFKKVVTSDCGDHYLAEKNEMPTSGIDQRIQIIDYSNAECSKKTAHPINVEYTTLQFDPNKGQIVETKLRMSADVWTK
jgi:hypothetical protein